MSWLLNTVHTDLRTSKKNNSIIYKCFQGELEVVKEIPNKQITEKKENNEEQNPNGKLSDGSSERDAFVTETSRMPFLMLGLDLPPPPLFKDVMEKNIIPQVGPMLLMGHSYEVMPSLRLICQYSSVMLVVRNRVPPTWSRVRMTLRDERTRLIYSKFHCSTF